MNVNQIIENVEINSKARVFVDNNGDWDESAYYIPEEQAIGINPNQDDNEVVQAIIHEVAHHVDIVENENYERGPIDEEVIAHAVEEIVYWNAPVQGVISEVEGDIRDSYRFKDPVSVSEDDIVEVAERVRAIVGAWD